MLHTELAKEVEYFHKETQGKDPETHPYLFERLELAKKRLQKETERMMNEYGRPYDGENN